MDSNFINYILPSNLLEHFTFTGFTELCFIKDKTVYFELYLEENNKILGDIDGNQFESKGFTEVTLQDFPIRGKAVYLVIKRRRWRNKKDAKNVIRNDFSFVAEGSVLTKELSDFLKGTGRYKG